MSFFSAHPAVSSSVDSARFGIIAQAVLAALSLVLAGAAQAAGYTWDPNTSAAGTGGTGDWTTASWTLDGSTFVNWPGTGNTAVFDGTPGTVTVGTQTASGLTFNVGGYTFATGTLTLTNGSIIATNGGTTTLANTVNLAAAGGAAVTKTGLGTFSLGTVNGSFGTAASPASWKVTGGTLSGGMFDSVLSIEFGSNLGAAPSAAATQITLDAGTLQIRGAGSSTAGTIGANRRLMVNAAGGAISDIANANNYYFNPIVNNAAAGSSLYLSNTGGTATFTGTISGAGSLTWNGAGAASLQKANTYAGGTVINSGVVELTNTTAAGTGAITVNNGGELSALGSQVANAVTVNAGGTLSWDFFSGSGDYQGPVTLAGNGNGNVALSNFYGAGAMSGSISGNISGPGTLTTTATNKAFTTGGGTLTLKGTNNTYGGGTVIGRGTTVALGSGGSLGSGGLANNGGALDTGLNNVTVPTLTSQAISVGAGLANQSANYVFRLNAAGTPSTLAVGGVAAVSGTTGVIIDPSAATAATLGTSTLMTAAGGLGGTVKFAGGEALSVPTTSVFQNIAGTNYRLTLGNTATSVSVTLSNAPAKTLTIMPLGSSITAGQSA
ncbi:MAG: hypothetical protein JWM57_470, partial [Phycisphaerales bacterium]|nr:hypothetical protein [Phycisphaerales bacterium]